MSKVLITGANGFIGKPLHRKLVSLGYQVLCVNSSHGDITDKNLFFPFETEEIDHVFHLASKSYIPDSWINPSVFFSTNVIGTQNVLEFCRKKKINMTYVSAYLYGIPEKLPISEEDRVKPNNPYAHTKYLAEQICEFYSREFNVSVTIIRPFNVYGKGQREVFLIPVIIDQAKNKESIYVMDLSPRRDYIYVDDLVDALILTLGKKDEFSVYNIGSGVSMSVQEIIAVIQNVLKTNKPVSSDNHARRNEMPDVVADISKARQELKWHPAISFIEGISRTIN